MNSPPAFDQSGYNVLDPHDYFGIKSDFITLIQHQTLRAHLPRPAAGDVAADVGCGYGRHCGFLRELGFQTVGIDPDAKLLEFARAAEPAVDFRLGALPELPLEPESCSLLCFLSMWRVLHLMGKNELMDGVGRYLKPGGSVALIENMRPGHPNYVPESSVLAWADRERLELSLRLPFRLGRRWYLYAMMAGLYPRSWLPATAEREARHCAKLGDFGGTYANVLFLFRKRK